MECVGFYSGEKKGGERKEGRKARRRGEAEAGEAPDAEWATWPASGKIRWPAGMQAAGAEPVAGRGGRETSGQSTARRGAHTGWPPP
jgi:hypothetical protein